MKHSADIESDAWTEYAAERRNNPVPLANPHRLPYGSDEQKEAVSALEKYSRKQEVISARLHRKLKAADSQRDAEEVNAVAMGSCIVVIALPVVVFTILFSSKYPDWQDVVRLMEGWK